MGSMFIDLNKAFDTVNHDIYISNKLNYYYVCHESLPKLKDYFSERKQLMCIDSQSFEELAITSSWTPIVYYCQFSVINGLRNIISCLHKR